MGQNFNSNMFNMKEEEKVYNRFLRMPKKLAYGKDTSKSKRIIEPMYTAGDYHEFDHIQRKQEMEMDFEAFRDHS